MWVWLALLAAIIFFMYMWQAWPTSDAPKGGCNVCPHAKPATEL